MDIEKIKFPIGKLQLPEKITSKELKDAIETLKNFPSEVRQQAENLTEEKLDAAYRPGGWTIRQLIHHISDSHNHAYNRLRWMLTENNPTIKAYDQDLYAAMPDYKSAPVEWSLSHIEILHKKMVYILKSLNEEQWNRNFFHPETKTGISTKELALTYSWHSKHHLAHIENSVKM